MRQICWLKNIFSPLCCYWLCCFELLGDWMISTWLVTSADCTEYKVWRQCGQHSADWFTDGVTAFCGGGIFIKTRPVTTEGHLSAVTYRDEILQPAAVPYLHNLGPNSLLQEDGARLTEPGLSQTTVAVERMERPANSLDPTEHWWDQLPQSDRHNHAG